VRVWEEAVEQAAAALGAMARRQVPLGPLTTYRVGGAAALAVIPADEADLIAVGEAVRSSGVPVLVVGRGSNLLVSDAGFPGLAVLIGDAFDGVEIDGTLVRAGGGASLPVVARRTAAAALTGFEWAVGVPGSVGGAVRMNAGGHGSDMAACVERARIVDLLGADASWRPAASLEFGYRRSDVRPTDVVVGAELRCRVGERSAAEALVSDIVRWRRANQPGGQNAGSVFTNPDGDSAGRLVEAAGLKGHRRGTAQVSAKHANFIQADEGGSADDVRALIGEVRERVRAASGAELRTEVRLIGFPGTYPQEMASQGGNGG
jgi:UDP-N-acetylmuramate dehydrogenase